MKQQTKKVYKARPGAPFKQGEAQVIGEYIAKIGDTPEKIWEDAHRPDSPIHHLLEWDGDKAAKQWQISQVKNIVNHISVEVVYVGGGTVTFDRALVYVGNNNGGKKIVSIEEGLSVAEYRSQLIAEAWTNLTGWMNRYEQYKEFNKVVKAIKETGRELQQQAIIQVKSVTLS